MTNETVCKQGHLLIPENILTYSTGSQRCRLCRNESAARWRAKHQDRIRANVKTYMDSHYFGSNREKAIQRDGEKCVVCGMTRIEHRKLFGRDITVDHIDGNGSNNHKSTKNNKLENLQTLCTKCHGRKDGIRGNIGHPRRMKVGAKSKSGILGLTYIEKLNKWQVYISPNGAYKYIGVYESKAEALAARDAAYATHSIYLNDIVSTTKEPK